MDFNIISLPAVCNGGQTRRTVEWANRDNKMFDPEDITSWWAEQRSWRPEKVLFVFSLLFQLLQPINNKMQVNSDITIKKPGEIMDK